MIRVCSQYYVDKQIERQIEIDYCLQANLANPIIDSCVVISDVPVPVHDKLTVVSSVLLKPCCHPSGRPTFGQVLALLREISADDDINVICNSDIYFDQSLEACNSLTKTQAYCLGRWNTRRDGQIVLWDISYGQDAWFFRGPPSEELVADFPFGYPGCDNRFAWDTAMAGYSVRNPALTIKAIHKHASEIRNYPASQPKGECKERIPKPYLCIEPATIDQKPNYLPLLPGNPTPDGRELAQRLRAKKNG